MPACRAMLSWHDAATCVYPKSVFRPPSFGGSPKFRSISLAPLYFAAPQPINNEASLREVKEFTSWGARDLVQG